jgi:large subunit ribosomal protein L4
MVDVKAYADGKLGLASIDEALFAHPKHGTKILGRTLKEALVMYEARQRAGTHKTKTRSEVHGPNHKLWKQKHTGRARMGTDKSPLWRGGGVIFGPRPRDYSYAMPLRARRIALRTALLAKLQDGELLVADDWLKSAGSPAKPSTRAAFAVLKALGAERSALVVTDGPNRLLALSLRNLPHVDVCPVTDLNAYKVLQRQYVIMTRAAFASLGQVPVEQAAAPAQDAASEPTEARPKRASRAKAPPAKRTASRAGGKAGRTRASRKPDRKTDGGSADKPARKKGTQEG